MTPTLNTERQCVPVFRSSRHRMEAVMHGLNLADDMLPPTVVLPQCSTGAQPAMAPLHAPLAAARSMRHPRFCRPVMRYVEPIHLLSGQR
jgi:hypothetical protein